MIRPGQQSHQVRHHQADEADHPRCRHRRTHAQCGAEHQFALEPLDIDPEMSGLGFAEQQCIQCLRPSRQPQRHASAHQQQRPQARIAGAIEAAQVPERQCAQGGVIGQVGKQAHRRAGERREGDTGEQHGRDMGLAVARPSR